MPAECLNCASTDVQIRPDIGIDAETGDVSVFGGKHHAMCNDCGDEFRVYEGKHFDSIELQADVTA